MPNCFVEAGKLLPAILDGTVPEVRKKLDDMPDIQHVP